MTTRKRFHTFSHTLAAAARERDPARDARARARALAGRRAALACAALLGVGALAATRTPRAPRAPSTPSTAQILAPSAATVPDALPPAARVFRCGNSYSAQACDGARQVDVADPRTAAQRAQAADLAARDKRLAAWLEAGRREREKVASAPLPARVASAACTPTKRHACAPQPAASKRVAMSPAPPKAHK